MLYSLKPSQYGFVRNICNVNVLMFNEIISIWDFVRFSKCVICLSYSLLSSIQYRIFANSLVIIIRNDFNTSNVKIKSQLNSFKLSQGNYFIHTLTWVNARVNVMVWWMDIHFLIVPSGSKWPIFDCCSNVFISFSKHHPYLWQRYVLIEPLVWFCVLCVLPAHSIHLVKTPPIHSIIWCLMRKEKKKNHIIMNIWNSFWFRSIWFHNVRMLITITVTHSNLLQIIVCK